MQGLGYKEFLAYLDGEYSLLEAEKLLKQNTRHFAKRQLTWFRREKEVIWLDKGDYEYQEERILAAMLDADVILLTSPVYALHLTGQMKTFLDHYACTWMVHKPNGEMFGKQGVVIASASGPVYRAALREMKDSLDFWGVAHTYKLGFTLMEISWDRLSPKLKRKISRQAERTAAKLRRGVPGPGLKTRCLFYAMRLAQKYIWRDSPDAGWWRSHGWLDRERPWKSTGAAPRRGGKREDTP